MVASNDAENDVTEFNTSYAPSCVSLALPVVRKFVITGTFVTTKLCEYGIFHTVSFAHEKFLCGLGASESFSL